MRDTPVRRDAAGRAPFVLALGVSEQMARRVSNLDHPSRGRVGWNVGSCLGCTQSTMFR